MTITEIATLIGSGIAICSFGGVVVYHILKGKFMTPEQCLSQQQECRQNTCRKIEEIKINFNRQHVESETKRDSARKETADKFEKIYVLIRDNEEKRAHEIAALKFFMGEITATMTSIKEKLAK